MFPDYLPDYVSYWTLLDIAIVMTLLLVVVGVLLLLLMRRYSRLQLKYDTQTIRYQRAEEQLQMVWQKEHGKA